MHWLNALVYHFILRILIKINLVIHNSFYQSVS
jgi:hypothetical protein